MVLVGLPPSLSRVGITLDHQTSISTEVTLTWEPNSLLSLEVRVKRFMAGRVLSSV